MYHFWNRKKEEIEKQENVSLSFNSPVCHCTNNCINEDIFTQFFRLRYQWCVASNRMVIQQWCSKLLYRAFAIIIIYLLNFSMLTQLLDIILVIDNMDDFATTNIMLFSAIGTLFKAITAVVRRERIIDLMKTLQEEPCKACNEEELTIQTRYDRLIRLVTSNCWCNVRLHICIYCVILYCVQVVFHELHISSFVLCHGCHDRRGVRRFARRTTLPRVGALWLQLDLSIPAHIPSRDVGPDLCYVRERRYGNPGIWILLANMRATWNPDISSSQDGTVE